MSDSSTVGAVGSTAAEILAASTAQKKTDAASAEGLQDRFLTLLVAQMKNQDPLSPLDNAQVTSQLAQINTVNGIEKLNNTMNLLSGNFDNLQVVQGAGMIGHSVLVPGNQMAFEAGHITGGGVLLDQPVDNLQVKVFNANGDVMQSVDLGPKEAGVQGFAWDGMLTDGTVAPDGQYTFSITATQAGQTVAATALGLGQVTGLTPTSSGLQLSVSGFGQVALGDVKQMF